MQIVRIAMLGSGFVADFYMQGLADVAGQEVATVYNPNRSSAEKFAAKWQIVHFSDNLAETIARDDINLYLLAIPNHVHAEIAVKLARAGRNQVCTKPLARSAEEARQMLEAVEDAGVMHGYAETEVFAPAVVRAERLVRAGTVGRVLWVRSRESHFGPHSPWFWQPELAGGGALMDMGCHCIEAARFFFGKDDPPVEVMAWGDTLLHETTGEDNALAIIRFQSGGIAHLEVSWSSRGGLDLRNEIHGSEGVIFTDLTRGTSVEAFTLRPSGYVVEKADADQGWTKPVPEEAFTYGYQAEMKHFVECIRNGTPPRETYRDGYVVNCVLDAAYRSMHTRTWQPIPPQS